MAFHLRICGLLKPSIQFPLKASFYIDIHIDMPNDLLKYCYKTVTSCIHLMAELPTVNYDSVISILFQLHISFASSCTRISYHIFDCDCQMVCMYAYYVHCAIPQTTKFIYSGIEMRDKYIPFN